MGLVSKDDAEPSRFTALKGFPTGQEDLIIQKTLPEQQLLLKCARLKVLGESSEGPEVNTIQTTSLRSS